MKSKLKILISFFIIVFLSISCIHSQDKQSQTTPNQPKVDIKVNKKYDDKGNVIGYDSTYSYTFSDSNGTQINDSIYRKFPNMPHIQFHTFHFNPDSIFNNNNFFNFNQPDIFNDPFFKNQLGQNFNPFDQMNKMLHQMDSLRNRPLIPAPTPDQIPATAPKKNVQPKVNKEKDDTTGMKIITM